MLAVVLTMAVILLKTNAFVSDKESMIARSMIDAERIAIASEEFFGMFGKWPSDFESLMAKGRWRVLETNDPWGHPFIYIPYDSVRRCGIIITFGADNRPDGNGENADGFACFGGAGYVPPLVELQELSRNLNEDNCPEYHRQCGQLNSPPLDKTKKVQSAGGTGEETVCQRSCFYSANDKDPTIERMKKQNGGVFRGNGKYFIEISIENLQNTSQIKLTIPCNQECPQNLYCGERNANGKTFGRNTTEIVW